MNPVGIMECKFVLKIRQYKKQINVMFRVKIMTVRLIIYMYKFS